MIDDNDDVIKPTQVAAKRDFYWYGKLERHNVDVDDVWWDQRICSKGEAPNT